jgi:uncharacterized membrane protein
MLEGDLTAKAAERYYQRRFPKKARQWAPGANAGAAGAAFPAHIISAPAATVHNFDSNCGQNPRRVCCKQLMSAQTAALTYWRAPQVLQQVETRAMPIGNLTGMTEQERAQLLDWIQSGAPH